ncbi:hypothetical protein G166_gp60 [Clostridium phage phi8074-B1]|uniref:hypothetical protein n=1 Tax=Clostridium phage phi8074-B1 TaxID=1147137 RepID=UPI00025C0C6F|nr:hypothetical protein G166_gp60 [Clostridium phage phi8074-B1]AFC61992.1 hypothetical protein phi8074-B1_00060 [Clostridium phage phi8074-B1]
MTKEQFERECLQYTREDFLNHVYEYEFGDQASESSLIGFGMTRESISCPSSVGLEESEDCCCSCYDCWKEHTEHITFKDTPREISNMKNYIVATTSCYRDGKSTDVKIFNDDGLISIEHDTGTIIVPKDELEFIEVKEEA